MRLAQHEQTGKWVVYYNGSPIAISGQTQFETREDAIAQISTRGLKVKDDGEIYRPVEPVQFQAPEPVEAPPAAAPAPVIEPGPNEGTIGFETPDHGIVQGTLVGDDAPSWADGTEVIGTALTSGDTEVTLQIEVEHVNPEFLAAVAALPAAPDGAKDKHIVLEMDPEVTEADVVPLPPTDVSGVPAAVEKLKATLDKAIAEEQEKIPAAEPEAPKGKRGRPRTYTPEEAAERRREQNRKYYHARKEARKAQVAERSKEWWETHPDKVSEYREKANEKRRDRYKSDPEYREKVAAYNRDYQARKRAERAAAKAAAKAAEATPKTD